MDCYLVEFVVQNNLPLSIVDKKNFHYLLDKRYKVPCTKTFKELALHREYELCMNLVLEVVRPQIYIGIQIDHYTATNHCPFANVCATFVSKDFKFNSVSLGTVGYKKTHTSEEIYSSVDGPAGLVQELQLSASVRTYTTDNSNTMVAAFSKKKNL